MLHISSANCLLFVFILYRIVGRPYTSKHRVLTGFCEDKVVLRCGGILFLEVCTRTVKYTGQKRGEKNKRKKEKKRRTSEEANRQTKPPITPCRSGILGKHSGHPTHPVFRTIFGNVYNIIKLFTWRKVSSCRTLLSTHTYTQTHTHTRTHARTHARTHLSLIHI